MRYNIKRRWQPGHQCESFYTVYVTMAAESGKVMIFLFHLSVFTMYVYTLIYDTLYAETAPHRQSYAGRFKFLTFWNQACKKLSLVATQHFSGYVENTQRRYSGVSLKRQDRPDGKTTFLPGYGTAKNMTGQTNILKAKLWELTLTRTSDPNRPTRCGIVKTGTNPYSWHYPTHEMGNKEQLTSGQRPWRRTRALLCSVACFLQTAFLNNQKCLCSRDGSILPWPISIFLTQNIGDTDIDSLCCSAL